MGTTNHTPAVGQPGGFYSGDVGNTWTAFDNQVAYGKWIEQSEESREGGRGGGQEKEVAGGEPKSQCQPINWDYSNDYRGA